MSKEITQKDVRSLFIYKDGHLYWKVKPNRSVNIGDRAGCEYGNGRVYIKCEYGRFLAHRLIFLFFNEQLPKYIDHIDGNGLNNKIENLRGCTLKQNQWNRKSNKNNKSGVKGVYFCNATKKYIVSIRLNGKSINGGSFNDIEKAEITAHSLRREMHKEFANNG